MAVEEVNLTETKKLFLNHAQKNEQFWDIQQRKLSLNLFRKMVKRIPAYRKFLKNAYRNRVAIKRADDLKTLPYIDKKNYFNKYGLQEVTWRDLLQQQGQVMTATSGSTGQPTYFARNEWVDGHYSLIAEYFLKNGPKGSTLLIDCFGMGVWIGGLITYQSFRMAALRGNPVTIITPGINKKEIFHSLRILAPQFDNVILAGYPPFIKDIIDEAKKEKIDFRKLKLRLLFAAESFTENFRDYIGKHGHIDDVVFDTMNLYGSAELGAMAFETPSAIFIRRLALKHSDVYNELFHNQKLPTLAQYNPLFVAFEEQDGQILITANSASPFMRYRIGDNGGVLKFSQIVDAFARHGVNLVKEAKDAKVPLLEMPFVYVYERADFSTTLYGLQIYPQTIKVALEDKKLHRFLTGKFTMQTVYDKKSNQYLELNVEMKPQVSKTKKLQTLVEQSIVNLLLHHNSEFRELTKMLGVMRTKPKVVFWDYNHEFYFRSGVKQQWLKK